jgi:Cytochrome c7 and related cytochrome c
MACHLVIAKDKPEIKKMAAIVARGEDLAWARVYDYSSSAHVRFNHAPHIRAGVACSKCHGDVAQQTVAVRAVNLNMRYCVTCHQQRNVSVDCLTCHF